MRIKETFAALSTVLLLAACDAGTQVDEAEFENGTDDLTIAETQPMDDGTTDAWATDTAAGNSAFEQADIADLDTDGDQQVTREEYDAWFTEQVWNDWDTDGDDQVTQNELRDTFWGWWDTNDDGFVDEREYERGRETFTLEGVDYADFDQVADQGRWDRDSFDPWFEENVWSNLDTDDRRLGREEAADTFWQWWDEDGDDRVDADEIARFGEDGTATTARSEERDRGLGAS